MKQTSDTLNEKIDVEIEDITAETKMFSNLVNSGIINIHNPQEVTNYLLNFMTVLSNNFPSLQSVNFADAQGSFFLARKSPNGTIRTEIIDRRKPLTKRTITYRDKEGKVLYTTQSNDFSYDPRTRNWFLAAKKQQDFIWTDVYPYRLTGNLGVTTALPIYSKQGKLQGVIAFNLRLDYIRRFIENMEVSANGIIYIVNRQGKVVAFPHFPQFKSHHLINIEQLKSPWLVASFNQYKETQQSYFKFRYEGEEYLAIYRNFPKMDNWMIGIVAPEKDFTTELRKTNFFVILFSILVLSLGICLMLELVNKIVTPLKKVVKETEKIKNFELDTTPLMHSKITEIHQLAEAIYKMKQGLCSFKKYVPADLVRKLIESGHDATIGGEKTQLAIFFSDIENFTTIAEKMEADQLMKHICIYFSEISPIIESEYGTVDKYIGDAVMAFWGAPFPVENPCHRAARTALRVTKRISELNQMWLKEGSFPLNTRIGLHFGEAIIGNLGSKDRMNYTAVGDVINTTSRLEGINKVYGTKIIVSDAVYREIKHDFALRLVDSIILKGRIKKIFLYELMAETEDELAFDLSNYQNVFAIAFAAYQKLQLDVALAQFNLCLQIYPADTIAPVFIKRCLYLQKNPASLNWNGVWQMHEK